MSKIGRNDPCWCGSGKKYKHCHLASDEAAVGEQRRLRQAGDTVLPRVIEHAQQRIADIPGAFGRFWNGKYTPDQMSELDEIEGRGAERFLTWFAFDVRLDDGKTLIQQLGAGGDEFPLSADEAHVLQGWANTHLRPYVIAEVNKGQDLTVRDMISGQTYLIEDQAATRRVEAGEVLVVHLLPVGTRYYIAGAAAHLTADTAEQIEKFIALHLEAFQRDHPDATAEDLISERSELLNHFVMELPVEAPDPTIFDKILMQTRLALQLTGESIGLVRAPSTADQAPVAEEPAEETTKQSTIVPNDK